MVSRPAPATPTTPAARRVWLIALPIMLAAGWGLPAVVAGAPLWFLGSWSDVAFMAVISGWIAALLRQQPANDGSLRDALAGVLVFVRARRPAKDAGGRTHRTDLPHICFILSFMLTIIVGVYDRTHGSAAAGGPALSIAGITCCLLALPVGALALRALGSNYAPDAEIIAGHRLVTSGIYRFIRHPIYLAVSLWLPGMALTLRSLWGLAAGLALLLPALYVRIRSEERLLLQEFGEAYRRYAARTRRLVPGLF